MARLLHVPYLGSAEEDVLLSEWFVAEGGSFRKGEALALVETLKATFEVEAEEEGILVRRLAEGGSRLPTRGVLGVVGAPGESVDDRALAELLREAEAAGVTVEARPAAPPGRGPEPSPHPPPQSGDPAAAPAARRRAAELGIALGDVSGKGPGGLIRVVDVEESARAATGSDGTLEAGFLDHLRREGEAFAALSSDFKVALYRRHGARIGRGAHIGPGSLLRAERLALGAGCHVGRDCVVDAVELAAGDLLHLGDRSRIRCRRVVLGDNAYLASDVEVGGGGAMDPEAELSIGGHGFVGEHAHLNPCRRLEIGDEVVISRGAVLMTHSFGASVLQGYPNRFAGIRIGDRAQVGIGATLFPGVEMGEGSILLSGSSLVSAVPPGRLFGGVPARDLKAAARPIPPEELLELCRAQVLEFARQLDLRGREVRTESRDGETTLTVDADGARHRLRFAPGPPAASVADVVEEIWVWVRISDEAWSDLPPQITAIDLSVPRIRGSAGPLGNALREFLRKRGVRLHPRTWTYPGGWL